MIQKTIKTKDVVKTIKSAAISITGWIVIISLLINVYVAAFNTLEFIFPPSELSRAGKFMDSINEKVKAEGIVSYRTNDIQLFVVTNEWIEQHK